MYSRPAPLSKADIEKVLEMMCDIDNFLTHKQKSRQQSLLHSMFQINWSLWDC